MRQNNEDQPKAHIGRRIVTGAVAATILIAAAWSVANISTVAHHYHHSRAAWLLGLAFGTANAISVYIFAISPKGSQARRPAVAGTLLFGVGSAAIQYHLYHELEAVAWNVAIWFAALGPAAEALLAWLEAALNADEEAANAERSAALRQAKRQHLEEEIAGLQAAAKRQAAANAELAAQLDEARKAPAAAPEPAPAAQPLPEQPTDEQTVEMVAEIVKSAQIRKAADLLHYLDLGSERSAQRALKMAKDAGAVEKNGAGYKAVV